MRKGLLIGVLGLMLLGMSSCEKQTVIESSQWKIEDIYVLDWQYTSPPNEQLSNNYYYAFYNWPSLSEFIFKQGNVQAYLVRTNTVTGEEMKSPLPYVESRELFREVSPGNIETVFCTATYNFVYGKEWIEFNYRLSNFGYEREDADEFKPQPSRFRVVLTW